MLCFRFDEEETGAMSGIRRRVSNKFLSKRRDDWSSKRMSRSFDGDTLSGMLAEGNGGDVSKPSKKDLTPLPLDDVLKHSEVLARSVLLRCCVFTLPLRFVL